MRKQVYHVGIDSTGRVVAADPSHKRIMALTDASARRASDARGIVGLPFLPMPGNQPGHHVVGESADGFKVTVQAVEMVYNDAALVDAVEGGGFYRRCIAEHLPEQLEILDLAERLYA